MTVEAPALSVLCACGHAARMHGDFGCSKLSCGCSRDRDEANLARGKTATSGAAFVAQPAEQPTTDSAPVPDPSPSEQREKLVADLAELDLGANAGGVTADLMHALRDGSGHPDAGVRALATRITGELQALADKMADWDAKSELRERVEKLRAELATAEAELEDGKTYTCDLCGRDFENAHAHSQHRFRAHNIRKGDAP